MSAKHSCGTRESGKSISVFAWAGDVEAEDAKADGQQAGAGKVFPVLVQAQHENDPRDDPTVAKKAGAPGRDGNHRRTARLVTSA